MKEPTIISTWEGGLKKVMTGTGALVFISMLIACPAFAVKFNTGNEDLRARWDNTITYSAISRVADQDKDLIADPNTDDGDRNFDTGLVMNRFDLLSEADVVYKKFGVRASGAAWYDFVYNEKNDNNSPETVNHFSVPYNHFTNKTRDLHGRYAELLEAFTWGAVDMGDVTFRYRAGQYSQWWGDSFFLGWNGVAGALAPVDVAKAATLPNVQLKELIRPIPQVNGSLQVTDNLSFDAYYQFKWEPARLFGSGSYFSPADLIGPGSEAIIAPGPPGSGKAILVMGRGNDIKPRDDGQFGINTKLETDFASFGAYYNKFHSKDFYVVTKPIDGEYDLFYPEDIESYAVSANKAIGPYTFATEVTYRKNVPLQSDIAVFPNFGPFVNMPHEVMYPTGDTLNVIVNTFSGGMKGNFFCDEQDLIAEVAWVTELTADHKELIKPGYEKNGLTATVHYTPKWHQALPGLDLTLPLIVNYGFLGKPTSLIWGGAPDQGGDFVIGLGGTYNTVWEFEMDYRNFFGETDQTKVGYQAFADRDYVSFYIRRSF